MATGVNISQTDLPAVNPGPFKHQRIQVLGIFCSRCSCVCWRHFHCSRSI